MISFAEHSVGNEAMRGRYGLSVQTMTQNLNMKHWETFQRHVSQRTIHLEPHWSVRASRNLVWICMAPHWESHTSTLLAGAALTYDSKAINWQLSES